MFYSERNKRFYASRAWKVVRRAGRAPAVEVTGLKFDVTDEIAALVLKHKIDFSEFVKEGAAG
jgi:hypothetical protein